MLKADFDAVLEAARDGDDAAFARVWRDLNPALVRYTIGLAGHRGEDAAAETWIAVIKRLKTFSGSESSFRSWVFTIARSKLVDAWRYETRRPSDLVPDMETIPEEAAPSAADDALDALSTESALRLISTLPREQAEVVLLRVVAGLGVEDVATIVGCSAGNVRIRQHRGLRKLAETLARQEAVVTQ